MNMRVFATMVFFVAFAVGEMVRAQDSANVTEPQKKKVSVLAVISCADWSSRRASLDDPPGIRSAREAAPTFWLLGFLSGLNAADGGGDALGAIDGETVADWIDVYCAKNPGKDLFDGANALYEKLKRKSG
jgi:hypothetical protein